MKTNYYEDYSAYSVISVPNDPSLTFTTATTVECEENVSQSAHSHEKKT